MSARRAARSTTSPQTALSTHEASDPSNGSDICQRWTAKLYSSRRTDAQKRLPIGIKSAAWTVGRSLPVYPNNRTSSVSAATSQEGHKVARARIVSRLANVPPCLIGSVSFRLFAKKRYVRSGSWSCKNALAVALTPSAALGGSATAHERMWAAATPSSPLLAVWCP